MSTPLRSPLRGAQVMARIAIFLTHASVSEASMAVRRVPHGIRQKKRARRCGNYARSLLEYLGFDIHLANCNRLGELAQGGLLVANHLSFWDVLALSSLSPCTFITSHEVRDTPVLGWIARLSGCVFVERRNRDGIDREIGALIEELDAGRPVVLFAEGTSSDGSGVLPFKRSLFRAAVAAKKPVLPVCLNYRELDGEPVTTRNRDRLFYYGDQTFPSQLREILRARNIRLEIEVLPALHAADWETEKAVPGLTSQPAMENAHRELCEQSWRQIHHHYRPIVQARPL